MATEQCPECDRKLKDEGYGPMISHTSRCPLGKYDKEAGEVKAKLVMPDIRHAFDLGLGGFGL
jgi:hypothetical protein